MDTLNIEGYEKYSLIYIVSMICFLVIAPSCTDMDEDTTGQMVSNDFMRILL